MNCKRCGALLVEGASFCGACGKPVRSGEMPSALSIVALSLAALGAFLNWIGFLLSLAGLLCGIVALWQAKDRPGAKISWAMALGAILLGAGMLVYDLVIVATMFVGPYAGG